MKKSKEYILICSMVLVVFFLPSSTYSAKIRDLCEVQGVRGNILKGIGLVVGLAGTGDSVPVTRLAQRQMLERLGLTISNLKDVSPKNSALVMVTAEIPPFAKEGTRVDVKVDAIGDCKSLEGGMLLETHLRGPGLGDTVYAVAQGPVSIGGFNAERGGGGTGMRKNHPTSGRIPLGAYIEREVPSTITDGKRIVLLLKRPDFQSADRIRQAIDNEFRESIALAMGGGAIRVTVPDIYCQDLVGFIARIENIEVTTSPPAKIVINERTGTIVIGGDVVVKPCEVAHGNLTIKITTTPQVTPATPFTQSQPVVTETSALEVQESDAYLMPIAGTSASEVAQALNKLKISPRDMISIFQALKEAGALEAELEVM
ncbi:MAG: flagellar basal body P-ring protein FlgI [Candidatus Hydrogenedentes bacterium]|nr:flagellar basal body P-ring protein FlgI [Candidatus Hydrogenedentota bacterium]